MTSSTTDPVGLPVYFVGTRGALFWLALKTGFLTVITLGFYRFWMKTRMRRWFWSATRPGGHPMEYVGDPWEKLLGFFIAVVILTFYIGIINLVVMFVSFSVFSSASVGYLASVVGVIPLWFYAQYRARRYVLARTRWRGVRFGLEKGAWGYAWRALVHWAITLLTLGLLWPRMTFSLEKYMTDRTYFGSARLHQGGHWTMLYRAAIPFILSVLIMVAGAIWVFWLDPIVVSADVTTDDIIRSFEEMMDGGAAAAFPVAGAERLAVFLFAIIGLIYGAIHYRFVSKRQMANYKTTEGVTLHSRLSGPRVASIYVLGSIIAYLVLVLGIIGLVVFAILTLGPSAMLGGAMGDFGAAVDLPKSIAVPLIAAFYLSIFLMWNVLYSTFVTFPLMRHMAKTLSLPRRHGLQVVSQRDRDEFTEAEGFAEALDLGAAI
ncbi:YjgN family protein [Sulfitobacter sp. CW3]|uniref:YjgN family protein n=1 Tax=Sulfitobacter sp. CW3 TaxID=2861965 RepID=UPI0021511908|nr:YjgN family protein [Sulfitobacter sp. CW3]